MPVGELKPLLLGPAPEMTVVSLTPAEVGVAVLVLTLSPLLLTNDDERAPDAPTPVASTAAPPEEVDVICL